MGESESAERLVLLGSSAVGKTALLRRYLEARFEERYKETVEDTHQQTFNIRPPPSLLSTSPALPCPAQRWSLEAGRRWRWSWWTPPSATRTCAS